MWPRTVKRILIIIVAVVLVGGGVFALWVNFATPAQVARTLVALERARVGLDAKTVQIPEFRIAYLEGGHGQPLVLLHGFGGDKDNWTAVSAYLMPYFRVIAPDLPGFGDSDKRPDRRYLTAEQVEYLRAFVHALGIDSFHLGGNSMGGRIAAEYAAKYPAEVQSLWLLAPGGVVSAEPSEMLRRLEDGKSPLVVRTLEEFDELLALVMTSPPYLPPALKRAFTHRAAANAELHQRIFYAIGDEWMQRPLEQVVAGLKTPTRIVWGQRDRVLHVSGAEILRAAMPRASVLTLPYVGHLPMMEAPAVVAGDYLAFRNGLAR